MSRAQYHTHLVRIAVLAVLSASILTVLPVQASTISNLAGRWTGWGAVTLASGATERVKCVATYFIKDKETKVRQNLRCASPNYKIDSVADYVIKNGKVTGSWEERSRSNTGEVLGKSTAKGFKLAITGETWSADISVTTGKCKQSISFVPTNLDVTRISIGLRKC